MVSQQKKRKKKNISLPMGHLYVHTTPNNTIITLTDPQGNKVSGGGTGMHGFNGAKESTPFAAEMAAREIISHAKEQFNLVQIGIICKGTGIGRDGVFKAINDVGGVDIMFIKEATPLQTGGCRGKRPSRG